MKINGHKKCIYVCLFFFFNLILTNAIQQKKQCVYTNGHQPSLLIGLKDGTIIRWNTSSVEGYNNFLFYGETQAEDEPYFPLNSPISIPNSEGWTQREFFQVLLFDNTLYSVVFFLQSFH